MTNPFQDYPPAWIDDPRNPIVHVIRAEQMWRFINDQEYDPLTPEEWAELRFAFAETDVRDYFDEVLVTLRPNHHDHCVCA